MFEFDGQRRETSEQEKEDQAARYRALPLRMIRSLEKDAKVAILDCGHRKALLVWLREGDSVRCQDCYDDGMRSAERLIGG